MLGVGVFVNAITLEPLRYREFCTGAKNGQKIERVRKWVHSQRCAGVELDLMFLMCVRSFIQSIAPFCRAMLHVHKRGLCRPAVSVHPSVTFTYCIKTSNRILKLFSQFVAITVQVFHTDPKCIMAIF